VSRTALEKIGKGTASAEDMKHLDIVKSKGDVAKDDVMKWRKIRRISYPKESF